MTVFSGKFFSLIKAAPNLAHGPEIPDKHLVLSPKPRLNLSMLLTPKLIIANFLDGGGRYAPIHAKAP